MGAVPALDLSSARAAFESAVARVRAIRLPGWLPDAPDDEKRARSARMFIALAQTPLLVNFIGWWGVAWLATVLANEFYINAAVSQRVIMPYVRSQPARANNNWALLIVWGSLVYSWGWVYAWFAGGPAVSFLAPFWLTTCCIHGLTYFSNQKWHFLACIGAGAVSCIAVPLTFRADGLPSWCVILAVSQFMVTAFLSFRDRHLLTRAVIRSRAEMRAEKQSNVAKSQFLATMSHELRTPLNAVIGYAEILEEDLATHGFNQGVDDAARISRAARHLLTMINEILDLSKIEAGKLEIFPREAHAPTLLQTIVEQVAHLARDNDNELIVEIAPNVGNVVLDTKRFHQCVVNLAANACKFTTEGKVTIRAEIDVNNQLRVEVKDTGCGIPEDKAATLFEPFVQVDASTTRKHEGAGLGLAITRRLARLMGGDVTFVSAVGKGTTFTLILPAVAAAASTAVAA